MSGFLPITKKEMRERGITQFDFVYVIGDAYVDHPSFGHAIISRLLESHGYSVGIISQPDWKNDESIAIFGEPRLGFLVSAGNMDSMVNHYSVSKKRRQTDAYTPGGVMGKRPDRALTVYSNLIRRTYKKTPIILGGIEASLRRLAHYDYWSNSLKRSVLLDSGADILSYGMGERSILAIAEALDAGIAVSDIGFIPGTVYKTQHLENVYDYKLLPSFEVLQADKTNYAKSFYVQYCNTDSIHRKTAGGALSQQDLCGTEPARRALEPGGDGRGLCSILTCGPITPPMRNWAAFRRSHEIKFSLVSNRGCFGGCSFCALTFHQGRIIQTRSHESIVEEAKLLTQEPDFKGYIHDVGGPTANFRVPACQKAARRGASARTGSACFPKPCKNLRADHEDYLELLHKLRELPKVKKVFIRSGIRFDYVLADPDDTFFRELVAVSCQRPAESRSGACERPGASLYGQAGTRGIYAIYGKIQKTQRKVRHEPVPCALSHVLPSGLYDEGGREAGGILERPGVHAGAGAGFLPDALHDLDLHVLYGAGSPDHGTGLCADEPP